MTKDHITITNNNDGTLKHHIQTKYINGKEGTIIMDIEIDNPEVRDTSKKVKLIHATEFRGFSPQIINKNPLFELGNVHDIMSSIKTVQGIEGADPTDILKSFAEEFGDSLRSESLYHLQTPETHSDELPPKDNISKEVEHAKEQNLVKIYSMQKKLLQERKAYKEGLPLDFYENVNLEDLADLECQKWPFDYTFIRQFHYFYDQTMTNSSGKTRDQILAELKEREQDINQQRSINVYIILSLVCVFFINNTVFVSSSLFMYTIHLFVETLSFLYLAKYF